MFRRTRAYEQNPTRGAMMKPECTNGKDSGERDHTLVPTECDIAALEQKYQSVLQLVQQQGCGAEAAGLSPCQDAHILRSLREKYNSALEMLKVPPCEGGPPVSPMRSNEKPTTPTRLKHKRRDLTQQQTHIILPVSTWRTPMGTWGNCDPGAAPMVSVQTESTPIEGNNGSHSNGSHARYNKWITQVINIYHPIVAVTPDHPNATQGHPGGAQGAIIPSQVAVSGYARSDGRPIPAQSGILQTDALASATQGQMVSSQVLMDPSRPPGPHNAYMPAYTGSRRTAASTRGTVLARWGAMQICETQSECSGVVPPERTGWIRHSRTKT